MMRRGPGLVRLAAGTAVMAGTAGAVQHRQAQRYADQSAQQQSAALAAQQAQPVAEPAAPAATGLSMDEKIAQLTKLGELNKAGILTDEEFAAQKAAILAS